MRHVEALSALLAEVFAQLPRAELIARLDAAGVPAGAIHSVAEALADPQAQHRGMLTEVPHPSGVALRQLASPMRFADAPLATAAAPPLLGQHSDEILPGLGYGATDIAALRAAGVI